MQLTKFTHSCVRVDDGDRTLVVDPGTFSEVAAALDGADAVLITHEHPDHIDVDGVRTALGADPRLSLYAPAGVAGMLAEFGEQVHTVEPGQAFEAAGYAIRGFGGQHALIHPSIPMVANVGYLIEGRVFHPGDSFLVPPVPVELLLAPLHAPWSKTAEVIDYAIAVRAPKVIGIHDALLTPAGLGLVRTHVGRLGDEHGSELLDVAPGDSLTV